MQAYAHEESDRVAFARHAEAAYQSGISRIGQKAFLIASVMLIAFCAVGVILWAGGHDVFAGRLSAGELSAFVFYAFVVATGAGTVSEVWGELQRAAGATERLMEILDTRPANTSCPPTHMITPTAQNAISMTDAIRKAFWPMRATPER